ncbi:hypothetical protein J1605_009840 [Eschrichtius robustus]|uniref:Ribosomal protein L15 n=1 Tax=Eschrichtius robustus TaxID=9764 RepID=A0AB34GU03_ESCRO|nr:hypothetical protein J1605_009840 [Eschrichtius robustus]
MGCEAKKGYVRHRLACAAVAANAWSLSVPATCGTPVHRGATCGTPVHRGVNRLGFARSLPSAAEEPAGRRSGARRVLKAYWVGEDSAHGTLEVVLIDPSHKAKRRNPDTQWVATAVHKHRAGACRQEGPRPRPGPQGPPHDRWFSPRSLEKGRYSPAPPLPLTQVMFVKFLPNKQFRTSVSA